MRQLAKLAFITGAFLLTGAVGEGQEAGKYYYIRCVETGKVLAVAGSAEKDGAKLVQATTKELKAQHWEFVKHDRYYTIVNRKSGKVLDVPSSSTERGVQVQLLTDKGGANQQWTVEKHGTSFVIRARHSGMVLDVAEGAKEDGTAVIQYPFDKGSQNQRWELVLAK